jgi:hypothetical protein
MKNLMPLSEGKLMVKNYLDNKSKVFTGEITLPNTETYDSEAFIALLKQPDCVKIRIHYGMNEDKVICAIFVGVDSNGNEITIKNNGFIANTGVDEEYVIELSSKCPPSCSDENDQSIKKLIWN